MNSPAGTLLTLAWTFGLMSLLAIGGANSTIPEMHRVAVDVQHWLSNAQFADMFAIAQLSPGPNVLIVTLSILAFAVAIRPLGLIVSAFVSFLIAAMGSDETRWKEAVIVGIFLTIGCALLFPYALGLPLDLFPRVLR